jgi:endonuclease-8
MAEGPLVHLNARQLRKVLKGRKVNVEFGVRKMKKHEKSLKGIRIDDVEAYGKQFRIRLSDTRVILVHLAMWGYWRIYKKGQPWERPRERARLVLRTSSHEAIAFSAPTVRLFRADELGPDTRWGSLGPDPLREDFSSREFFKRLKQYPKLPIGEALLDQTIISGVGNILRIEILFGAKIHPRRKVADLTDVDRRRMLRWIAKLMWKWLEERGREDEWIRIYRGKSRPCPRCGGPVELFRQQDRITYACSRCQI